MGNYFSSVNSQSNVSEDILLKSKLGIQAEPKWRLSDLKINRHDDILGKGIDTVTVSAADIANGYEASVLYILAGDSLVSEITDTESGISIYRFKFQDIAADSILSLTLPEGVKNVHVLADEEIVHLPEWNPENRKIRFGSAWGLFPSNKYLVTFAYDPELQLRAPISENIVLEVVNYCEAVRSSIMNFNLVSYE